MNHVRIDLVPGSVAPRYEGRDVQEITLENVIITEQGTQAHLPMLDLLLVGADGKRYLAVITGRIACAIAASVRGVNLRNHGTEEP